MISILQNERAFQSSCYQMATSNVALADSYLRSFFTGVFTHSPPTLAQLVLKCIPTEPAKPTSVQLGLKHRCANLVKASLLLIRVPFLCMLPLPFLNRITQLALRCLSPRNPVDFIKACVSPLTIAEFKIRYKEKTRILFVATQYLDSNLLEGKEFDPSEFDKESSREDIREKLVNQYHELSPLLTIDYINSPECKKEEVNIRYSKDIRKNFVEVLIQLKTQDYISLKKEITYETLKLSDRELAAITKLGFTDRDYFYICLESLGNNPRAICRLSGCA